jgi:hypothetical protein
MNLEKIKHGIKTLAACGGIHDVDNTFVVDKSELSYKKSKF